MRNDFEEFYNNINDPELMETWENAKKEKKKVKIISTIIVIIITAFLIVLYGDEIIDYFINFKQNKNSIINFSFILPVFLFVVFLMLYIIIMAIVQLLFSKNNRIYNQQYKNKIIDTLFKNFYSDADYIPKKKMPEQIYKEGKYEMYDNYYSDDYMEAYIENKYKIQMAEIKTEEEREYKDSKGEKQTQTVTLFSGLFAKIELKKSIKNELRITPNSSLTKGKKLEMDSQEFEDYFDVTSSDKIIGMQLLTHDIMELLVNNRKTLNRSFDIYIKNDILYIRLHVGNMFEAVLNKDEFVDKESLYTYYKIIKFLDELTKELIELVEETQI